MSDAGKQSLVVAEAAERRRSKAIALARLDAADAPEDYARFYDDLVVPGPLSGDHHHHPDEKAVEAFVDEVCRRLYPPMPLLDILYDAAYHVGAKTLVNGIPPM